MTDFPAPPALLPLMRIRCRVAPIVTLGAAPLGERRFVPLTGGSVEGPGLRGEVIEGGVDWQIVRADGVLEIAAHYAIRTDNGAVIEVRSDGLRAGSPEAMAALARGEPLPREAYYFRTAMRFATGAPAWAHLNRVLALAAGTRLADAVLLDVYRVG